MKHLSVLSLVLLSTPAFTQSAVLHPAQCPKILTVKDVKALYDNKTIKLAGVVFKLDSEMSDKRPNVNLPISKKLFEGSIKLSEKESGVMGAGESLRCTLTYDSKTGKGWKIVLNGTVPE